jgi:hypothetical protein
MGVDLIAVAAAVPLGVASEPAAERVYVARLRERVTYPDRVVRWTPGRPCHVTLTLSGATADHLLVGLSFSTAPRLHAFPERCAAGTAMLGEVPLRTGTSDLASVVLSPTLAQSVGSPAISRRLDARSCTFDIGSPSQMGRGVRK